MQDKLPPARPFRQSFVWAMLCLAPLLVAFTPGVAKAHPFQLVFYGILLAVFKLTQTATRDGAATPEAHRVASGARARAPQRALIIAGALYLAAFLLLAWAIHAPAVQAWDAAWAHAVNRCGGRLVTRAVREISDTAGRDLVVCWLPFIALLLCLAGRARSLGFLGSALLGTLGLEAVCKTLVHRARPGLAHGVQLDSYPSGHALAATILAGALLVIMLPGCRGRMQRSGLWLAALLWPALVAASRVYLGCHYPTDAAGGVLLGAAWVCLCAAFLQWRSLRSPRKTKLNGTLTAR
jgi:membrane-associated phospholipid phosphatase